MGRVANLKLCSRRLCSAFNASALKVKKKIEMGHILVVKTTKICPISKRLHHTLDKMYNTTNIMIYEFSASLCVGLNMKLLD